MAANSMEARRSELLADAEDCIREALRARGVDQVAADAAGVAVVDMLANHWSGQQLTFPSNYLAQRAARDSDILARYESTGVVDLAREYGVSERAIRKAKERAEIRRARSRSTPA